MKKLRITKPYCAADRRTMKVQHFILIVLVGAFFILSSICSHASADATLPDGLAFLKNRMEEMGVPVVGLTQLKFNIPDNLPEEINNIKGYLWSGTNTHPHYKTGRVVYLLLVSYNRETGEMLFFRAWGSSGRIKPGWTLLTGKTDPGDKKRIELKSGSEVFFLLVKSGDLLTLRVDNGYEADLKKIGTITPPTGQ